MLIKSEISEFINYCVFEKNLSSKTIKAYTSDLKQFYDFLVQIGHPTEIACISKIEIRQFLESISKLKPKSIKRKIATLKALFNFLEFEDKILSNPFRKMRIQIREPKRLPKVMDINEITCLLKTTYEKNHFYTDSNTFGYFENIRNMVVVELLFVTGARVSEIANLKTDQVNLDTGVVTIIGKGNKERFIHICNNETLQLLRNYTQHCATKIFNSGNYFLINRLGSKLSDQSIRGIVKKISNKANIQKHITPHVFRHTLATLLLENDVDIKYIQSILGHSSLMTTQIYTHVNKEKQRQLIETKHPRESICTALFTYPE